MEEIGRLTDERETIVKALDRGHMEGTTEHRRESERRPTERELAHNSRSLNLLRALIQA